MAPIQSLLSRRAFLKGAAATAGAVTLGGPTLLARPARAAAAGGIHLAYGLDPMRQIGISWSTPSSVLDPAVEVLINGDWHAFEAQDRTSSAVPTVYHHASVTGLDPATAYQYRIRDAGMDPVTFRTASLARRPFRFAMFGDMGVNASAVEILARLNAHKPEFCFVAGDLCYADLSGGTDQLSPLPYNPALWDQWFAQIQSSASRIPWMPTVGNHEMERDGGDLGYSHYLAKVQLPSNGAPGGAVTYHYRYGNVAFIAADGNDASYEIARNRNYLGATQDSWLASTISEYRNNPAIDFIVVGFHNCMYCTNAVHGSDGGNRERWQAMFESLGVDVVVNGHNHSYERTHPLKDGEPKATALPGSTVDAALGTTYITAGGAGQQEYPTSTYPAGYVTREGGVREPETAAWSAVQRNVHSVAVVDVTPRDGQGVATMTIRAIAKVGGTTLDEVTLTRTTPWSSTRP
jgi:hypothetical protein